MADTYADVVYFEFTSNFKWRMGEKFDAGIEGRLANQKGIVRSEGSLNINYAVWQKDNKQLLLGLHGMVSEYFQSNQFNVLSINAGYRF